MCSSSSLKPYSKLDKKKRWLKIRHVSKFQWWPNIFFGNYLHKESWDISGCATSCATFYQHLGPGRKSSGTGKKSPGARYLKMARYQPGTVSSKKKREKEANWDTRFFLKGIQRIWGVSLNGGKGTPISHKPSLDPFSVGKKNNGWLGKPTTIFRKLPPHIGSFLGIFFLLFLLGHSKVPSSKRFGFIGLRNNPTICDSQAEYVDFFWNDESWPQQSRNQFETLS